MSNDVEIIDRDISDLAARPDNGGGLLSADTDNILYLADRAEKYISAMNRIMDAALKITSELDWCLIGGKPYLQESGATKVARLFGISIQLIGKPDIECDSEGYKTYTYKARFYLKDQFVECEGSRSMKEDFFAGKDRNKKPDEIDERDVKMAAYTNCINNGIKRLIPNLRNIDVATLERAGLDVGKISGYTFKTGSKGGNSGSAEDSGLKCESCGASVTQKVASYSQSKFGKILCMNCQKGAAQ
ncbi:MAG: hypothetical protein ACI4DY_13345 [Monoglobaceae bacterium]